MCGTSFGRCFLILLSAFLFFSLSLLESGHSLLVALVLLIDSLLGLLFDGKLLRLHIPLDVMKNSNDNDIGDHEGDSSILFLVVDEKVENDVFERKKIPYAKRSTERETRTLA